MAQQPSGTFLERLAARTRPAGASAAIESRRAIVSIITIALWVAAVNATARAAILAGSGETTAAWSGAALAVTYVAVWVLYAVTGGVRTSLTVVIVASTLHTTVDHILLGGFAHSGAYLFWGITLVMATALVFPRRVAIAYAALFSAIAVGFGVAEPVLSAGRPAPGQGLVSTLFASTLVGNIAVLAVTFIALLDRLVRERERSERLLLNVLPAPVAEELKEHGSVRARRFAAVSVLFADIAGFTPLSATLDPEEVVSRLNDVFSRFDDLAARHGCEKIRTIGDGYMVACGVPVPRTDHARALATVALEMIEVIRAVDLDLRIGMHTGPVVAGVIGTSKFQYDVWGDTVNTASRMESHGVPGRIHVTGAVREALADDFDFEPRDVIEVKGKGEMETYFLIGPRSAHDERA